MAKNYGWNAESRSFDCQSCGACCLSPIQYGGYVGLHEDDFYRITQFAPSFVDAEEGRLKTKLCSRGRVCMALNGTPGGSCRCGIYAIRPQVCKEFEPGSIHCIESRKAAFGEDCKPDLPLV